MRANKVVTPYPFETWAELREALLRTGAFEPVEDEMGETYFDPDDTYGTLKYGTGD